MLDLVRISGVDVIVVFHRRRSRRSYARQKRTPRPEHKYFLFSRGLTAGTRKKTEFSLMKNLTFRLLRTYAEARSGAATCSTNFPRVRSEERRVGKECR